MLDKKKRDVDHLRVSLTNKCNLDCFYCHKEGNGVTNDEMITSEVMHLLKVARESNINSVKFTGGEPLLRDDIIHIIKKSKELDFKDIGITTNGTLLNHYATELYDAGLRRVNIGCDSMTATLPKNVETLKNKIFAAKNAGLNVKLNMVALKGVNHNEISDMIKFSLENKLNLQLIELVKFHNNDYEKHYYSLDHWEKYLSQHADNIVKRKMQNRKRYFFGENFVEIIKPSKNFCSACNKIRVTSNGKLRQCLMNSSKVIDFNDHNSFKTAIKSRDFYGYD
jgi:GTP 3',8-cyclase